MSAVKELIRNEENGTISFGDYTRTSKTKLDNYEYRGDLYKIKTFREITKLEKNGLFVYESVPGTAVTCFREEAGKVEFLVEGPEDAQITLELEADCEYEVSVGGVTAGIMKTNLGGKVSISAELSGKDQVLIKVRKKNNN